MLCRSWLGAAPVVKAALAENPDKRLCRRFLYAMNELALHYAEREMVYEAQENLPCVNAYEIVCEDPKEVEQRYTLFVHMEDNQVDFADKPDQAVPFDSIWDDL